MMSPATAVLRTTLLLLVASSFVVDAVKHFDTRLTSLHINTGGGGKKEDIVSSDTWTVYGRDRITFLAKVVMTNSTELDAEQRGRAVKEAYELFRMHIDGRRCETINALQGVVPPGTSPTTNTAADVVFECVYMQEQSGVQSTLQIQLSPQSDPVTMHRTFVTQRLVPVGVFSDPSVEAAAAREVDLRGLTGLDKIPSASLLQTLITILPTHSDAKLEVAVAEWTRWASANQNEL